MKFLAGSILVFSLLLSSCSFLKSESNSNSSSSSSVATVSTETMGEESSVSGAKVSYTINYDASKWYVYPSETGADSEYDFEHVDGDVYGMVIPERIEIPLDSLKEAALLNAQAVAPDAQIIYEETRTVNGVEVLAMKMQGTIIGIPFEYYGYYYGGDAGTIQFITYTSSNLTPLYQTDLEELLNGLAITE